MMQELWVFQTRADGIYILIEEIGGQGEMGPFARMEEARSALADYLRSVPLPADPPVAFASPRVMGRTKAE